MRAQLIAAVVAVGLMATGASAATRSADALPAVSKVAVDVSTVKGKSVARLAEESKAGRAGVCRQLVKGKLEARSAKKVKCAPILGDAAPTVLKAGSFASLTALQLAIAGLVAAGTTYVVIDSNGNTISQG